MYKEIAVAFVACCVKFIIKYCKQRMLQMKLQANVCANHAECCLDKLTKSKELSKLGDGRMGAYSGQYGAINAAQNLCHFSFLYNWVHSHIYVLYKQSPS